MVRRNFLGIIQKMQYAVIGYKSLRVMCLLIMFSILIISILGLWLKPIIPKTVHRLIAHLIIFKNYWKKYSKLCLTTLSTHLFKKNVFNFWIPLLINFSLNQDNILVIYLWSTVLQLLRKFMKRNWEFLLRFFNLHLWSFNQ